MNKTFGNREVTFIFHCRTHTFTPGLQSIFVCKSPHSGSERDLHCEEKGRIQFLLEDFLSSTTYMSKDNLSRGQWKMCLITWHITWLPLVSTDCKFPCLSRPLLQGCQPLCLVSHSLCISQLNCKRPLCKCLSGREAHWALMPLQQAGWLLPP